MYEDQVFYVTAKLVKRDANRVLKSRFSVEETSKSFLEVWSRSQILKDRQDFGSYT